VVDSERVVRLLDGVRSDTHALRTFAVPRDTLLIDEVRLSAVKYRFITAIEGCARVAHHLVASEGWAVPDSNANAVRVLDDHGVITKPVAQSIAGAVGFRNVLVHQYAAVDDSRVIAQLDALSDFDAFVSQVGTWLLQLPD
jgi:uncharacterized protein YutE (UPF0331/DUF86 family)